MNLEPVLGSLAHAEHLAAILRVDTRADESMQTGKAPSIWLLMARSPEDFLTLGPGTGWGTASAGSATSMWTDDFSNIWTALKR